MKRSLSAFCAVFFMLALANAAFAQVPPPYGFPARNPCASASSPKSSAPINIASATTAQIIAAPTGNPIFGTGTSSIYVCGWSFTETGTSPTYQWIDGTGSNCATPGTPANLTGVIPSISTTAPNYPPQEQTTVLIVPPGQALCMVAGGTTPSAQGFIFYTIQ
jgi:hypothetical protein